MQTKTFKAIHVNPDGGARTLLGSIQIDDDGQIKATDTVSDYLDYLSEFVQTVNGKDRIPVKCPPGPHDGRFELSVKLYKRSSPDFVQGVGDYAKQYFSIVLEPESAEIAPLEVLEDLI